MSATPALVSSFADDIEPTDEERRRLTRLAQNARDAEKDVVRATNELRQVLRVYHRIVEEELPEAMRECGQSEFKLLDGTPVALKSALNAKQLTDANPAGLAWVEANGGKPLVRATITAEFDAEDLESAEEIYQLIRRHPAANRLKSLKLERCVLWNTLTKWVGELIEGLRDPPLELLGVARRSWAQVGDRRPKTVELKGFAKR